MNEPWARLSKSDARKLEEKTEIIDIEGKLCSHSQSTLSQHHDNIESREPLLLFFLFLA